MKNRKSIEVILSLVPTLSPKEIDIVRKAVGMQEKTACERLGHNMKPQKKRSVGFFNPVTIITLCCTRCPHKETI